MRNSAAFTLLEVLVVLAVIAIITAVALPAIARSSPERKVMQQAERIKQVLDLMCENAELDGRELGFAIANNRYEVLIPAADNSESDAPWQAFKGRDVFAKYELTDGMRLTLSLGENAEVVELRDELPAAPQLPCSGASELPAFRLTVSIGSDADQISRSITVQPPSVEKLANWSAMIEALPER
jgi:type II secretion system protein H